MRPWNGPSGNWRSRTSGSGRRIASATARRGGVPSHAAPPLPPTYHAPTRRPRGQESTASLGSVVTKRLVEITALRPDTVEWSAKRREDGAEQEALLCGVEKRRGVREREV